MSASPRAQPTATRPQLAEGLAALAVVLTCAGTVAGRVIARRLGPHPTAAECEALLERYVFHLAKAREEAPRRAEVEAWKRRALARSDLRECTSSLTRPEAECALASTYADEFERCLP